jgi:hypothetical protein
MAALLHRGSAGFIPSSEGGEFSNGYTGIFAPALTFALARPISVSKLSSLGTWRNRQGCDRTSRFLLLNSPILW